MRVGHGIGIDIDLADLVSGVEAATFTTSASLVLDSNSEQVACAP
jgi:exonuclease VII large subunit